MNPRKTGKLVKYLKKTTRSLPINRSGSHIQNDLNSLAAKVLLEDISRFRNELDRRGLKYTNWVGELAPGTPKTDRVKNWENISALLVSNPRPGSLILDAGGASTLFSFYLAWRGYRVVIADIDYFNGGLLENARRVSGTLDLGLQIVYADLGEGLPFSSRMFDYVYCLCVLEHLTPLRRVSASRELGRVLKKEGVLALTIDYVQQREDELSPLIPDRGLRFGNLEQLVAEVIRPSGLSLLGNPDLNDDLDPDWFVGCLFFKKQED